MSLLIQLLFVLVLLLVICITISSSLHDGERTTLGCSADHFLLDSGRDGGGLLLLGLGCLNCGLLLGCDDTCCRGMQRDRFLSVVIQ